ncbi:MAG: hypothetical protein Q7V57_16255 [Actinomycetota bacterium]|nr:hypothetical protein [Actinomycetota bacterium]
MTDEELDLLVRQASPISDAQVDAFDLGSGERHLLEAIMSNTLETVTPLAPGRHRSRRRTRRLMVVGAMAVAAATVATVVIVGGGDGGSKPAYAADILAVAEANDRVLIDLPGWSVSRADEFTVDQGEMTFSDGAHEVEVHWRQGSEYASWVNDRASGNDDLGTVTVLGRQGRMFRYVGTQDYTALVEPAGASLLEVRGVFASEADYRAMLGALKSVDVDTWLAALPASVVKPSDRTAAVDEILVGVPLPVGFDTAGLFESASVSDRYQLVATVTGTVVCAWFDQYFTAIEQGDDAAAKAASDALISSHQWPALLSIVDEGDFAEAIWEYADATLPGGTLLGEPLTRDELALGLCRA